MPCTPTAPYALGRGEGELVWWSGHAMLFKSHGDQTGGTLGLIETELHAGFEPPMHHHVRDDEFYYVLEGEMTFRAGDVDFELKDGGYIFLPRKVAHGFMVRGSGVARVLMCTAPAGPRDSGALFYDHGLRGEGTDPPQGVKPIDPETMTGLLSQYGIEIEGAPLPVLLGRESAEERAARARR